MIRNILLDAYGTLLSTGNGSVRAAGEILAGCADQQSVGAGRRDRNSEKFRLILPFKNQVWYNAFKTES